MDAKTLFKLVEPHLNSMKFGEKRSFANLISSRKYGGRRKKIISLTQAKENLRRFSNQEMAKAE